MNNKYKKRNISFNSRNEYFSQKEKIKREINNSDTLIEKVLNARKMKYIVLDGFFKNLPKKVEVINFYYDVNNLIKFLHRTKTIMDEIMTFSSGQKFLISSLLINTAAHFRNYFYTRHQKFTNFYFYYSMKPSKNEIEIYPDYKKDFHLKYIGNNLEFGKLNALIKTNLKLCSFLSDYFPHIYFIDTKEINPIVIPYHFIKESQNKPNEISVIYSNDKMNLMNCAHFDNVFLLQSNYNYSALFNKDSIFNIYHTKLNEPTIINPKLIPYMFSISGYSSYNIKGVPRIAEKKTITIFEKMIKNLTISNIEYNDEELFIESIKNEKTLKDHIDIIQRNLQLFKLDLIYNKLTETQKLKLFQLNDYQDLKNLIKIDNTYYQNCPLQFDELMLGEDYETL